MMANRARKTRSRGPKEPTEERGGEARLAVNIPAQLHRQLKARAAEQGTSIRDFILELLRKNGIT